jgi:hypothetical protein
VKDKPKEQDPFEQPIMIADNFEEGISIITYRDRVEVYRVPDIAAKPSNQSEDDTKGASEAPE